MQGVAIVWAIAATVALLMLTQAVYQMNRRIKHMAILIDDLLVKVTNLKTVQDSAIALLQGLSAQLNAAIAALPDQQKLQTLADALDTDAADMAAAVTANTPVVPAPPVPVI